MEACLALSARPHQSRLRGRQRHLRQAVVLLVLTVFAAHLTTGLLSLCCRAPVSLISREAFAALTGLPAHSKERAVAESLSGTQPAGGQSTAEAQEEEVEAETGVEQGRNSTAANFTLQLGDAFPVDGNGKLAMGPEFVRCHVTYAEGNEQGVSQGRTFLEEWVMQGSREHITAFKAWRGQQVEEMDFRCSEIPLQALEEVQCMACVPASGPLPLTPTGRLQASQPGTLTNTYVLTISGVDQCLAGSLSGSRFCQSGSVAVAM